MKKIFLLISFILSINLFAISAVKLDNYSLQDTIEYLAEVVNKGTKRESNILRVSSATPKDDTLQIVKILEAKKGDMNGAILVDTILFNLENNDKEFLEDFVDSQINLYCASPEAKILFNKAGYIRIILRTKDGRELIYFDLAKASCH